MDERVGRVLAEVWSGTEGYVFIPWKFQGKWGESAAYKWPDPDFDPAMVEYHGADQYFCPLVFAEPHRQARYALPTHVLWADLDEASPEKCLLRPSIAWRTTQGGIRKEIVREGTDDVRQIEQWTETMPHWQALWLLGSSIDLLMDFGAPVRVNEPIAIPAAEAAALSKRIAYAEPGADRGGWDVTQVLRLPGTYNHKHTPPQLVELLWAQRRYYTPEQIREAYPPVPSPSTDTAAAWPFVGEGDIERALTALPVGIRYTYFERSTDGADRSLELLKLARTLLGLGVAPDICVHLLARSTMGRSKFAGRSDAQQRLLTLVQDATTL